MEAFASHDVGRIQSSTDSEAHAQSAPWLDAAVCIEAIENADKVFGTTMAKDEYEDHQCHLRKSETSFER